MNPPERAAKSRPSNSTHQVNPPPILEESFDVSMVASDKSTMADIGHNDKQVTSLQVSNMEWEDSEVILPQGATRLQVERLECVETKTITTTTTTKRSYPPLIVRPPRALHSLDAREYPLAVKPTPEELTNFSFEVDGKVVHLREEPHLSANSLGARPASKSTPRQAHERRNISNPARYETPEASTSARSLRRLSAVPGIPNPRRSERSPDSLQRSSNRIQREFGLQLQPRGQSSTVNGLGIKRSQTDESSLLGDVLPTPDTTELEPSAGDNNVDASFISLASENSSASFEEPVSPSVHAAHGSFPTTVATPPIADTDLEPFNDLNNSLSRSAAPLSINTSTQNASLPSPSLSPTIAAANLQATQFNSAPRRDSVSQSQVMGPGGRSGFSPPSQQLVVTNDKPKRAFQYDEDDPHKSVLDTRSMLDTFDAMPDQMKSFMMYQFLRRCTRKTLHMVAGVVSPALKCDFLQELPPELSLHILSFLSYKDLCRAAQVSKRWRNIIDSNETGWKELLDRDGFVLPAGELERAIKCGWGWQDPYGADGWERDLSISTAATSADSIRAYSGFSKYADLTSEFRSSLREGTSSSRLSKRKRGLAGFSADRSKRRALSHETSDRAESSANSVWSMLDVKSDGPNAAATAAALAVPNPNLGLPSLSKLHLFKSLYRRRFMLQSSWMSGKVQPQHIAFPAHPRHVITCLQFDDDKILTGSDDTFIHVYDTRTGKLRKRLEGHEGGVWALQYEGNVLVSGSTDRSVRVWDIEKGLCTQVFHGHTSTVRCLQILMPVEVGKLVNGKPRMVPEKPLIITGSRDSQLRVWKLPEQGARRYIQTGPPANDADCPYFIRTLTGHTHSVRAIAAHQDTLVSGSYDCSVRVWKISTGETLHSLRGHGQKVYSVVLDHERRRCISGSMDNTVKIWSLETGACLFTLEGHSSLVGLLDLRDGRLVSAAADSTLRIWDPEDGRCKNKLTAHTGAITCFQHDATKVISGSDRTLKMWNVKTGECLKDLLTDLSGVWQVKFDDRRCVAAVQRDSLTYIEVLDFGASRDGIKAEDRGRRILLQPSAVDRIAEEDDFGTDDQ